MKSMRCLVVHYFLTVFALCISGIVYAELVPNVIRVGKYGDVQTISSASKVAKDGAVVEIEPGDYVGDVAVWTQKHLTIRGVGGRPRLIAKGASAERKGIWVIRGDDVLVENIEFYGASVPDRNGAGIRLERGKLVVKNCLFGENQMGILTSNDPNVELEVERSEFWNGTSPGGGVGHNLYAGKIAKLKVMASYFHNGRTGHLLKTRAQQNFILYNRLTDEDEGRSSYELEFPVGGIAYVIGNSIQQGQRTENATIVSYGAEGYQWPVNRFVLAHNTIVNDRPSGRFLFVKSGSGPVRLINNVFVGEGSVDASNAEKVGNVMLTWEDLAIPARFDYRLKGSSKLWGSASEPGGDNGFALRPAYEYQHPLSVTKLQTRGGLSPGAFQTLHP